MRRNALVIVLAASAWLSAGALAQTPTAPAAAPPPNATTGSRSAATLSGSASGPGGYLPSRERQPSGANKNASGLGGFPATPRVNGSSAGTYTGTGIVTGR